MSPELQLTLVVTLALLFDYLNGFHDSANVVATLISSRAMTPRAALLIAAAADFAGPLIFGVAVAKTIGSEVAAPDAISLGVILSALLGASLWNLATWFVGLPSSSSHALIGGIIGAVVLRSGWAALTPAGLIKIGVALFISPILGFLVGSLMMWLVLWLARGASPKANIFFRIAQLPTAVALALSHGSNDAQKTMGIITLALVTLGYQETFTVPLWVILVSATAIALGTATGGWRIIHTLGAKFYRIRPIHSFTAQLSAATIILTASLAGGPVSTTHVVSTAILGVGAAQRRSQVRWQVLSDIMVAWVLTIPASAGLSMLFYLGIRLFLP